MIKILKKFFAFCGETNRNRFYKALAIGVLDAVSEALKIPALMCILNAIRMDVLDTEVILFSTGLMLFAVILGSCCKRYGTMLETKGGYETAAFKRIEIAEHMKYLPMGYFNANSLGFITSVTTNTMELLGNVATRVILLSVQGILNTAVILGMLFLFDIRIARIGVLGVILFLAVNAAMQRRGEKNSEEKLLLSQKLVHEIMEYLQGISEIKSYGLSGKRMKQLNDVIDWDVKKNLDLEYAFIPYMVLQSLIVKLTGALMMYVSIRCYIAGNMDFMHCIGMTVCAFILYASLDNAGKFSALLHVVDGAVDKAKEILSLETMDTDGEEIEAKTNDISLRHVCFSYGDKEILHDISLDIPEHTTTAIVGPSGGGKTTLCHLIARFWDVDSGEVLLSGTNVKRYSMDSLMKHFSFVFQNVYLFSDTIANNIRFGRENASMEEIVEAAKRACCHDFISALPDGYDTVIGEGGQTLSGGEKQRISIARAMLKDAPVIILDEATANIDPENEKELTEAIQALTKEKTILMIAHRLKTVRDADRILVVDKGSIVQEGTHEELMKEEGIYRRFVLMREKAVGWKLA